MGNQASAAEMILGVFHLGLIGVWKAFWTLISAWFVWWMWSTYGIWVPVAVSVILGTLVAAIEKA